MLFVFQKCSDEQQCVLISSCSTGSHIPSIFGKSGNNCENKCDNNCEKKCCDISDIVKQQPTVSTNDATNVRATCSV